MAARNDLIVLVGVLLCLVVAANADSGTAIAVEVDAQSNWLCGDISVSDNMIAIVTREKFVDGMCGAQYLVTCESDPSTVDYCYSENNQVTVTIIGVCGGCVSELELSAEAFYSITNDQHPFRVNIQYEAEV